MLSLVYVDQINNNISKHLSKKKQCFCCGADKDTDPRRLFVFKERSNQPKQWGDKYGGLYFKQTSVLFCENDMWFLKYNENRFVWWNIRFR